MMQKNVSVGDRDIPVTCVNTVIVGAGAAAMNCAVKLIEFWRAEGVENPHERLAVVTAGLSLGASRMSGSDKQTYYKMGTSPRIPDTAADFAKTLTAFGCCHGDTALVEGVGSLRGFYHLVEVGVPFPHDPWGAFIGYKTDHDPYERATSAGPKTSKFMSECLQAKLERFGVAIIDKHPVAQFLTDGEGPARKIVGLVCVDVARAAAGDALPISAFVARNWVLAGGGPGEVYQTTVYPRGQYGFHAAAFEAGLEACNLTESQYGLASIQFRWNVSGTYMQVVPRIFSTGPAGPGDDEREFLTEYFADMPTMATNVFLKGYQWPFDAQRIVDQQSTLVDMAVHQETVVRGRRVYMDFLANPVGPSTDSGQGAEGWDAFSIDALGPEAKEYLEKTGALQALPIDRLKHMNPPAIEIYAEHGIDLFAEPLEIAVCAQHMNGGFAVNKWWESNVPRTFVIGEMAGTHGVKRPGGSALNAGQVGANRAAECIAHVYGDTEADGDAAVARATPLLKHALVEIEQLLARAHTAPATPEEIQDEVGRRMTRYGAHLRSKASARQALNEALAQYRRIQAEGVKVDGPRHLADALRARQQCLTHVAMLKAICALFERGAGSRGSHCILDPEGTEMHPKLTDPATDAPYRFRPENVALRDEILHVLFSAEAEDLFETRVDTPRPIPARDIAFEPAWTEYREGTIYGI